MKSYEEDFKFCNLEDGFSYVPYQNLLNTGDRYKEDVKIGIWKTTFISFYIFFSRFILVRLTSSYIPKFSLLAFFILETAMKKVLKLGFGR